MLGRDAGCDLNVHSPEISRRHLRLALAEEGFEAADLGSTAGSFHDGQPLSETVQFAYPNTLTLGTVQLRLDWVDADGMPTGIGHFSLGREIARGGMGAVMEANDQLLGRTVAMKVILDGQCGDEVARLRFIREATVMGQLEHPNIVPIHEMGRNDAGEPFYTMKKVAGRTLQVILNELRDNEDRESSDFTLDRLLNIFRKVCDAIGFAHSRGIVHRDLKPENIMVGAFGEVLVMDWGLAKILQDRAQSALEASREVNPTADTLPGGIEEMSDGELAGLRGDLTVDGAVMGSPQYMSPEQADGRIADIDARSDIFSLGGVLYAILTLRPPFRGKRLVEVLEKVLSANLIPPTDYNPLPTSATRGKPLADREIEERDLIPLSHCPSGHIPSALAAVALKALKKESAERYQSVDDLAADVEAYQQGYATSAEDVDMAGQIRLWLARNRALATAIGLAILVLFVVTGFFMIRISASEKRAVAAAGRAEEKALEAEAATKSAVAEREKTTAALNRSFIALADAAYLDGDVVQMRSHLNACEPSARDTSWHYLNNKLQRKYERIVGGTFGRLVPEVTRGGQFLGMNHTGAVFAINPATATAQMLVETATQRGRLAISADGAHFVTSGDGVHSIYDSVNGSLVRKIHTEIGDGRAALSSGAKRLLVWGLKQAQMFDATSGEALWSPTQRINQAVFTRDGKHLAVHHNNITQDLRLLDAADGSLATELPNTSGFVKRLIISPDGRYLAAGDYHGDVLITDLVSYQVKQRISIGTGMAFKLCFVGNEYLVAESVRAVGIGVNESGAQRTLRIWSVDTGQQVDAILDVPEGSQIAASPQGDLLMSGFDARLWRLPVGKEAARIQGHYSPRHFALLGGKHLFTARGNVRVFAHRLTEEGALQKPRITFSGSRIIQGSNPRVAIAEEDGKVYRFEVDGARIIKRRLSAGLEGFTVRVALSHSGKLLARHGSSGVVLQALSGDVTRTQIKVGMIRAMAFAANDERLAILAENQSAPGDRFLLYDLGTLKPVHTEASGEFLTAVAASGDGRLLAMGGDRKRLQIRDAKTGTLQREFRVHDKTLTQIMFHPERPIVATAAVDLSIKLWNVETGEQLGYFVGPGREILALRFNAKGTLLAVSSVDRTTRVWNIAPLLQ